ncbi:hypothetical protein L7F22_025094 [Adiantum nelumboides]|nr:hypothetical protein [Adiantum nelumboides]
MADTNEEGRINVDSFDFANEGASEETPMLVNYLITRLQQAMANPALQVSSWSWQRTAFGSHKTHNPCFGLVSVTFARVVDRTKCKQLTCSALPCLTRPSSTTFRHQVGVQEKDVKRGQMHVCKVSGPGSAKGTKETFLTLEEAGLIELSSLENHERFLCRLTVSSLNLLRIIAKQEGKTIEELNAGVICDWFQKDKAKGETDDSATLQW